MLQKFNRLSKGKKIIIGMIALILFPITLLLIDLNLIFKGIKDKKKIKTLMGLILVPFVLFMNLFAYMFITLPSDPATTTSAIEETNAQETTKADAIISQESSAEKEESALNDTIDESTADIPKEQEQPAVTDVKEDNIITSDNTSKKGSIYGSVQERPVMNGFKTEKIGTYGRVLVNSSDITEENLIELYNNVIKDSGYNWFTIAFTDGKDGIVFPGASYFFTYGKLDTDGAILESKGLGTILDGKIDYESEY